MSALAITLYTVLLSALIEFVTVFLRLIYGMKAVGIDKQLHLPRWHHSYTGLVVLGLHLFEPHYPAPSFIASPWMLIIALALISSDLLHHTLTLPLLRGNGYDLNMTHYNKMRHTVIPAAGVLLIVIGIGALLTPLTPGSWLAIIGAAMLLGRKRARTLFQKMLGKRLYKTLKIDHFLANNKRSDD